MKLNPYLTPYTKVKSKWIKDLNKRLETVKALENIKGKLTDVGLGNMFFWYDSESTGNKSKIDKWDCIKLKGLCRTKDTTKEWKDNLQWEDIFTNHTSD